MEPIYIADTKDGPVACMLGPRMSVGALEFCRGCLAYDPDDIQLCLSVNVDCCQNGHEVLAEIKLNVGTRFTAETHTGRIIEDAIVHCIVDWRERPYQVYWSDKTGKHIEPFSLDEFKRFKVL